ncbi:MAG: LD-carboxypeptidase [Pseudomonadales bacterium]|jgi:muramoyltetrapeptide carboxypeptidase|tara:strand:- start:1176 stop:2288 length:1113 start_codon:yes stop_codon:yes gene_type:complete
MNRRDFLHRTITAAGLGTAAFAPQAFGLGERPAGAGHRAKQDCLDGQSQQRQPSMPRLARRLQSGMTIGLIAPASNAFEDHDLEFAMDIVRSLGFKVKPGAHLFDRRGYLAGLDAARANDLNTMFEDPAVDAIFCARGGFGASKLLPLIDYDAIARNPKILLGYSDITALHLAINGQTGLITFHGPIATQQFSPYTVEAFRRLLQTVPKAPIIGAPPPFLRAPGRAERINRLKTLKPGQATGRLIGGNLSLITHLLGTPYAPDFRGAILFLEDVDEAPYRIDRMLTALWLAGVFDQIAGLVIGKFTNAQASGPSLSIDTILNDRVAPLSIPVLQGLMIGHIEDQATLPVGAMATLDADRQQLTVVGPYLV